MNEKEKIIVHFKNNDDAIYGLPEQPCPMCYFYSMTLIVASIAFCAVQLMPNPNQVLNERVQLGNIHVTIAAFVVIE